MAAQLIALRRTAEAAPPAGYLAADAATLSRLIGLVYDAPDERSPWTSLLEALKGEMDAAHAVLILRPATADDTGLLINAGTEDAGARTSWERRYFAADPFVGLADGEVVTAEDLLGNHWLGTPIYQDYLRPLDIRHLLAADIRTADGAHCSLRLTRSHASPAFDAQDKGLVRLLVPHLRRAIELHARLETLQCDREVFAGTVERLQLGVISLGAGGEVLGCNDEARRILEQGDGIGLGTHQVSFDSPADKKEFQRIVQGAIVQSLAGPGGVQAGLAEAMAVWRPSGSPSLALIVKPAPAGEGPRNPRRAHAVVYLRDPASEAVPASGELVRRLYGLTRVESRLALMLSEGNTLDETAERMGIRRNTARTHLRAIFEKTGVTRQTMLVRLMLRSVLALG